MVSSASSVRVALREPWRANPPRPPAEPGAAAEVVLLAVLGAAEADDTDEDWDASNERSLLLRCRNNCSLAIFYLI